MPTLKSKTTGSPISIMRLAYLPAVLVTIILGLALRKFSNHLPVFIAENAGDVLWAMMVYFGFRFFIINKSLFPALIFSFLFSYLIEFSQLYQANWINQLRGTMIGALILGHGYLTVDLIRYGAGIILAAGIDKVILMIRNEDN